MTERKTTELQMQSAQAARVRKAFWLQQYATAFTHGDKRAAALALQFVQQCKAQIARGQSAELQVR